MEPDAIFAPVVQAGGWSVARRAIDALVAADPGNPSLHYSRGLIQLRMRPVLDAASAGSMALSPAPGLACCGAEAAHPGSDRPDAPGRGDLKR